MIISQTSITPLTRYRVLLNQMRDESSSLVAISWSARWHHDDETIDDVVDEWVYMYMYAVIHSLLSRIGSCSCSFSV